MVNTSRSDSLIKYEEALVEQSQIRERSYDMNYTNLMANGYYNNLDNSEYISRIRSNMNKISRSLGDKLKEANKGYIRQSKKETDNRKRFEMTLNDAVQNVKLLLNKK
jgi:hypothetical protein